MAPRLCSRCGATAAGFPSALCPACLLRLATLPESRVPDFEIETLLGSGSGTTYLARAADGRLLAVKTFGVRAVSPAQIDALDALSSTLQGARHQNIATFHAIDVDDEGAVRLIRDYARGRAFDDWLASAGHDAKQAALDALSAAVMHAHDQGLAHGNLISANVVIAAGAPVLLDLGAASALRIVQGGAPDLDAMRRDDLARLDAWRRALP